jgi:hypothetical protein
MDPLPLSPQEKRAAYKRQWAAANCERIAEQRKVKRLADPEGARERNRQYYLSNRDEILLQQQQYRAEHQEECRAQDRAYWQVNAEKINQERRARYAENPEPVQQGNQKSYAKHRPKRLAQNRVYNETHPEIVQKAKAEYRARNQETLRAKGRAYIARRQAENPEAMHAYQAGYQAANRDKVNAYARTYRAQHRDERNAQQQQRRQEHPEYEAAWRKAHPEVSRLKQLRRLARKRGLPDTFTAKERLFMLQYWHHACAVCGNQDGFFWKLADDHVIPLSSPDCPGTVATNIIPLCHGKGGCNTLKRDHDFSEWLLSRMTASQAQRVLKAVQAYFALVQQRRAA